MNIRKVINEYCELIDEGLKDPILVNITKTNGGFGGEFEIGDNGYTITIDETTENCFIFKFTRDGSYELQNDIKKAFQVIPTIEKVVDDFINQHKPKLFSFFLTDGSRGRDKMYSKFSNTMGEKYGYNKHIKEYENGTKSFILFKNGTSDDDFKSIMTYVEQHIN